MATTLAGAQQTKDILKTALIITLVLSTIAVIMKNYSGARVGFILFLISGAGLLYMDNKIKQLSL